MISRPLFMLMCVGAVVAPGAAVASAPWTTARGHVATQFQAEALVGPREIGAGVAIPSKWGAFGVEGTFSFIDRVVELRGAHVWQLTRPRFATLSATVALTTFFVPGSSFDFGIGPHGQLSLALGGSTFAVDLFIQSGAELFVRSPGPRLPQRIGLGATLHLGSWAIGLAARTGVDLTPGHQFVLRGELLASFGWWGVTRR